MCAGEYVRWIIPILDDHAPRINALREVWSSICISLSMFRKQKSPHLLTGERGELLARWYLHLKGYRILERNYLCPPGEIDIIAMKKGVLVFVEVRTRQAGSPVNSIESITDMKLVRFMDAARYYLISKGRAGSRCRFDIISVQAGGSLRGRIRHYIDAFQTTDARARNARRLKAWFRHRPRPGGRISKTKSLNAEGRR